jgi:hypothetical protein
MTGAKRTRAKHLWKKPIYRILRVGSAGGAPGPGLDTEQTLS